MMGLDVASRETMDTILTFLRTHAAYGPALLFGVMFLEGVIVTTFLFSGSLMLLAAGALIQTGVLSYWPTFAAIVLGFWMGDTVNYLLGHRGETWFRGLSAVRKREAMVVRAEGLLRRWGWAAVFVSRFMGPTRPFVTFLAGVFRVPATTFHLATLACTVLLTAGMLNAGMTGVQLWNSVR